MKTIHGHASADEFNADTAVDEVLPLDDVTPLPEVTPGPVPFTEFDRDASTPKHDPSTLPGFELGRRQGQEDGHVTGYSDGYFKGRREGRTVGIQEALDCFYADAVRCGIRPQAAERLTKMHATKLKVIWAPSLFDGG